MYRPSSANAHNLWSPAPAQSLSKTSPSDVAAVLHSCDVRISSSGGQYSPAAIILNICTGLVVVLVVVVVEFPLVVVDVVVVEVLVVVFVVDVVVVFVVVVIVLDVVAVPVLLVLVVLVDVVLVDVVAVVFFWEPVNMESS